MNEVKSAHHELLKAVAEAASDKKAVGLVAIDVGEISTIADYFIVCCGQNERQTKTIADAIEERLSTLGVKPHHVEGRSVGSWILMDYGDVIISVFLPETRDFYDLERLWGDCERLELEDLLDEAI